MLASYISKARKGTSTNESEKRRKWNKMTFVELQPTLSAIRVDVVSQLDWKNQANISIVLVGRENHH